MKTKHQIDLHVTPIRRKGKKRVYYICLGNPHYKNPSLQKQALIFLPVQQQKKDQQEWLVLVTGGATTTTKTRSTIYFSSKNTATTRRSVCVGGGGAAVTIIDWTKVMQSLLQCSLVHSHSHSQYVAGCPSHFRNKKKPRVWAVVAVGLV